MGPLMRAKMMCEGRMLAAVTARGAARQWKGLGQVQRGAARMRTRPSWTALQTRSAGTTSGAPVTWEQQLCDSMCLPWRTVLATTGLLYQS